MGWLKGIPRKPHDDEGRALLAAYERATEAGATFEDVAALRASAYYCSPVAGPAALEEVALGDSPGWEADIEELERASMAPLEPPSPPFDSEAVVQAAAAMAALGDASAAALVAVGELAAWSGLSNIAILQPREALDTEPEVSVDLEDPRYLRYAFPARHPWREHDGFEVGAAVGERVQAWLDEGAPRRELDRFAVVGPDLVCVSWPDPSKRRFRL